MKYRIVQFLIITIFILLFFRLACASDLKPSWLEHFDLMQVVIAALFTSVCWFFIRTLRQIDKSQCELFDRMRKMENDFSELKGEHQANMAISRCK